MNVLLAGGGKVALALEAALREAPGIHLSRWSRADRLGGGEEVIPDVAVLAIADGAIGAVAEQLLAEEVVAHATVLLHTAGALSPEEAFARVHGLCAGTGLLHPLRAIAGGPGDQDFAGTVFAVAGDDAGRRAALALVTALGGRPLVLTSAALPRYHAAAVLASNHTLALVEAAVGLLVGEGLARREAEQAIAALVTSAARNVEVLGLPAALTGPIARGDLATVEKHLAALPPAVLSLYLETGRATLAIAREKHTAASSTLDRIARLFDEKS